MSPFLFWIFALLTLIFGTAVVINRNPVASALSLVVSFLGLAALFMSLNAYFIGIILVLVYAGAVMLRRNLIIIFMSLELMLNAANLSLVAFSRFRVGPTGLPDYNVQVFVFFIITVAAAEVAVGLAILVALYRARQTTDVKDITSLKF